MDKSMYSLILLDDVVRAVDELASERGTSRSNLVSQILAEYVSLITPEKRIEEIFRHAALMAQKRSVFQMVPQLSGNMLTLRSSIHYKYNPAIRYAVEITAAENHYSGELKVSTRTQSKNLLSLLNVFFELWTQVEHSGLPEQGQLQYKITGGKFRRRFMLEKDGVIYDSRILGEAIGVYVSVLDRAMGLFFKSRYGVNMETYGEIVELYEFYVKGSQILV